MMFKGMSAQQTVNILAPYLVMYSIILVTGNNFAFNERLIQDNSQLYSSYSLFIMFICSYLIFT